MKHLSIYIHIPFCKSKCTYCNFNSYVCNQNVHNEYIDNLIQEIENFNYQNNYQIDSIFIGGGTPSLIYAEQIEKIMQVVKNKFHFQNDIEISIECNPNTVTEQKATIWKQCGINRISLGMQTLNDDILKTINRSHNRQQFLNAVDIIKNVGFTNINVDLMIGLPNQTLFDVKDTVNIVLKLPVTHISCYTLIVENNTPIYNQIENNQITIPDEDKVIEMFDYVKSSFANNNFNRYEISNFAKTNFECTHNKNCWEMKEYIGFGAGAHSYYDRYRFNNFNNVQKYDQQILIQGNGVDQKYILDNDQKFEEYIMLGLRLINGINIEKLNQIFNIDFKNDYKFQLDKLVKQNLIIIDDNLKLTDYGTYFLNKVVLDILS